MNNYAIIFFKSSRGQELVKDFVRRQDRSTVSKAGRLIDMLGKYGPNLGMPYSRYLGDGLYELRIKAKNEVRIFYMCLTLQKVVVILHAFNKRTQKLPQKELLLARKRQKNWTKYNT